MARREFTKAVKAQIVTRAMTPDGQIACEGCGLILGRKPYNIDHTIPTALIVEKRKLTAEDGKLLGKECCHDPKTRLVDVPAIAKAKRNEAKNMGITRPAQSIQSAPFARSEKASRKANRQPKPQLQPRPLFKETTHADK